MTKVTERSIGGDRYEARDETSEVVYDVYRGQSGGWVASINLFRKSSDGFTVFDIVPDFPTAVAARKHAIVSLRKTRRFELAEFVVAR